MNRQHNRITSILYVAFVLSSTYYGVDIRDTCRILPMEALTRVRNMPSFFKGTVYFQGKRVPVVDLKKRLGLKTTKQTAESRIVVINVAGRNVGFIVDDVSGVLPIPASLIEPVNNSIIKSNQLSGIAVQNSKSVLLLDLDKVFSVFNDRTLKIQTDNMPTPIR